MKRVGFFGLLFLGLWISGCSSTGEYRTVEGSMLGTTLRIVAQTDHSTQEIYHQAMALNEEMNASMSIFTDHSLLSRLNRNLTDSVDCHIAYNLTLAREISALSDGAYDVTVKPLVEAWGFAGRERDLHPNLDSLLEFVGIEKVSMLEGEYTRLVKEDARLQLDFNSIAKGYTVDLLASRLEQIGVENYLVDIGGEVRCRGVSPKQRAWRIGVERPIDNIPYGAQTEAVIALNEGAMATSGNYRRYFVAEGRKVGHTINPTTGESQLSRLLSATVLCEECARADALATMLMAMGAEQALRFVEEHPELATLLILAPELGGETLECRISPAMEQLFEQ